MILGDNHAFLELTVGSVEPDTPGYSSGGDVLVVARIRCLGFRGETDAWILQEAWEGFLSQLTALERERRGEAVLESISPGELRLRIFASDRAGHIAVEGSVGVRGVHQELRLDFSPMAVDPSQLPALLAELTSTRATG